MHFLATVASLASVAMAASVTSPACSAHTSNVQLGNKILAEAATDIDNALSLAAGFKCPAPMAYSPWTKACSCLPGQKYDTTQKSCSGSALVGAWPLPKCDASGSTVALTAFCAISPTKFTKYDATHAWCQATIETFTFCAEAEIEAEISALGLGINLDVELDISLTSKISATLRSTSAALASLFIETLAEAVVIFNTNAFGLAAVAADVEVSLTTGVFAQLQSAACLLGFGTCQFDCVSFSTKGCHNYIDVVGALGGRISGLVGVTILPDVILSISSIKAVTHLVVKDMLCASLKLNTPLISEYKYTC
ncbi:uncharacterized protein TRIVIDRAFT_216779 [Trichoderma virens Gv29-8]|uniref:Extracellular membrane protein CFEM domain-containing protein n=1 Tax=Hypocrea virens (strain Gv29-8 / FGSC 10586) TaxID=413071 RepID=G9N6T9_HYPVG|nr:uncharacterized protein TRIVIDRAFT_216779 [Trichoderma virens Gv29-8]EHK17440.1 hypothetical protein TRIVIDRAFT_216779 [Trichoderma virens Gv29-8]UKZ53842.1 hypothetical protein TrVGV298_007644 [Trichoderma virens]